jgi:hypothetical protein
MLPKSSAYVHQPDRQLADGSFTSGRIWTSGPEIKPRQSSGVLRRVVEVRSMAIGLWKIS